MCHSSISDPSPLLSPSAAASHGRARGIPPRERAREEHPSVQMDAGRARCDGVAYYKWCNPVSGEVVVVLSSFVRVLPTQMAT